MEKKWKRISGGDRIYVSFKELQGKKPGHLVAEGKFIRTEIATPANKQLCDKIVLENSEGKEVWIDKRTSIKNAFDDSTRVQPGDEVRIEYDGQKVVKNGIHAGKKCYTFVVYMSSAMGGGDGSDGFVSDDELGEDYEDVPEQTDDFVNEFGDDGEDEEEEGFDDDDLGIDDDDDDDLGIDDDEDLI